MHAYVAAAAAPAVLDKVRGGIKGVLSMWPVVDVDNTTVNPVRTPPTVGFKSPSAARHVPELDLGTTVGERVCMYACACVYVSMYVCVCTYVCVYVCMCVLYECFSFSLAKPNVHHLTFIFKARIAFGHPDRTYAVTTGYLSFGHI